MSLGIILASVLILGTYSFAWSQSAFAEANGRDSVSVKIKAAKPLTKAKTYSYIKVGQSPNYPYEKDVSGKQLTKASPIRSSCQKYGEHMIC